MFSSEIDSSACETYYANHSEWPSGDITRIAAEDIPAHDILCAGFPCQAFSQAGKRQGFDDPRGQMFFEIARIVTIKRPKAFILENVPGLISHNHGKTLQTMLRILREDLGYKVPIPEVLNAKDFGLAQSRARIFIVGFRQDQDVPFFAYPEPVQLAHRSCVADVLETTEVSPKYYLSDYYWKSLQRKQAHHKEKGNKFGYKIISLDGLSYTLTRKDCHKRNLIIDKRLTDFTPVTNIKGKINRLGIRRLTPREWARLQGFPESFKIVVSDTNAYYQFGNSVAIPVVEAVAKEVVCSLLGEVCLRRSVQMTLCWYF